MIRRHFNALEEEEEDFTSSHSRTVSNLPGQLEAEEARELEEALRISAQEAVDRRKKSKAASKIPKDLGEPSTASVTPRKRKASSETSASSPSLERNITISTHSPLGQEWVEELGGTVVHSTYVYNNTTRFKICYHTAECYQALNDEEVIPHLHACGLGKMRYKIQCFLNIDYVIQFIKNYNRNTKTTKITSEDGQERTLTLSIDAVRNAYALDVVAEPYVDLRKLGNKLEGVAMYKSHKQRGRVRFVDIAQHLRKGEGS